MAAVPGDKLPIGDGYTAATDLLTSAQDIDDWAAEASGTIVEIASIDVKSTVTTVSSFSVKNAAGGHLLQSLEYSLDSPIKITYPRDRMPRLNGLTIDNPIKGASNLTSYSIIYRVTARSSV